MKQTLLITLFILIFPFFALAECGLTCQSNSLPGETTFKNKAKINFSNITIPRVVEFSLPFDNNIRNSYLIFNSESNKVIASKLTKIKKEDSITLKAKNTNNSRKILDLKNISDGNSETFAEFSFSEKKDIHGKVLPDVAVFDIISSRVIDTNGLSIYIDKLTTMPQSIRLSIIENGKERLLLPYKNISNTNVLFPRIKANHFHIEIKYTDILRIREIIFNEINVSSLIVQNVRFLALPDTKYEVLYNSDKYVKIKTGEVPDLEKEKNPIKANIEIISNIEYEKGDSDKDGVIDKMDNCIEVPNADQQDKDKNGKGDACEDFDKDGIINSKDNCPNVANKLQKDTDGDNKGDVCDSEESRFFAKYPWIPTLAITLVGIIVFILIIITLKKDEKHKNN